MITSNNNPQAKDAALYRTRDMHYLYIYESDNERLLEDAMMVGYYIYDSNGNMLDGGEYEYLEESSYEDLARTILSDNGVDSPIVKEYSFSEIENPDENIFSSENDIEWETPNNTIYLV